MSILDFFKKKVTDSVENHSAAPQSEATEQSDTADKEKKAAGIGIEEPQSGTTVEKDGKAHVYNLIILDESGSMGYLRNATLSGVNETINTIRQAQNDFADKQTHFLTLVTFDSPGKDKKPVRTVIDTEPISRVQDFQNYHPSGCTPLFDAMGQSISSLYQRIKEDEDATAIVTVMTDGLENASREYSSRQLKALIEKLKEEGWTFNYMGSAHDVQSVCDLLSIDNLVEFSHDEEGTNEIWKRERMCKRRMFEKMNLDWESIKNKSEEEKINYRKRSSKGFYDGE